MNLLQDVSIAVWYKDCSVLNKNKIILNTHIWGEEGTELCVKYFNSLEWDAEIYKERKNYRIKFSENSSKEIIKMYEKLIN